MAKLKGELLWVQHHFSKYNSTITWSLQLPHVRMPRANVPDAESVKCSWAGYVTRKQRFVAGHLCAHLSMTSVLIDSNTWWECSASACSTAVTPILFLNSTRALSYSPFTSIPSQLSTEKWTWRMKLGICNTSHLSQINTTSLRILAPLIIN